MILTTCKRLNERNRWLVGTPGHLVTDGRVACPERRIDVPVELCHACPHYRSAKKSAAGMLVKCRALPTGAQ